MCCDNAFDSDFLLKLCGLVVGALGVVLPAYHLLRAKRLEERDKRFQNYHRVIKELVEPDRSDERQFVDRQIAAVFELRNFPDYFEVTERILLGLKDKWKLALTELPWIKRLIDEADLTLDFIKRRR